MLLRGAGEGGAALSGSSCFHKDGGTLDFGSLVAFHVP